MMGIEVPETCSAYYKCNKPFSGILLIFLLYAYATMHGQTHVKPLLYFPLLNTSPKMAKKGRKIWEVDHMLYSIVSSCSAVVCVCVCMATYFNARNMGNFKIQ
jgi:hypothetical protein